MRSGLACAQSSTHPRICPRKVIGTSSLASQSRNCDSGIPRACMALINVGSATALISRSWDLPDHRIVFTRVMPEKVVSSSQLATGQVCKPWSDTRLPLLSATVG